MKKTYIAPCMEIVKVQTVGMIATSTMKLNSSSETVSGSDALSRGGKGGWDDDE